MIHRIADYFSRIGKARGFGIQSPFAYSFVRDVIMEKQPYYAYADIETRYESRWDRKREKLYHRLRNYCHGHHVIVIDLQKSTRHEVLAHFWNMTDKDIMVLENIYADENTATMWAYLRNDEPMGITFDLYKLAICFKRSSMYKQHYKLNF